MQEKPTLAGQNEDGVRMLNPRGILAHYRHIKAGVPGRAGCKICTRGLGTMVTSVEKPSPKPVVDEGGGADEEGDSASARADGWPYEKEDR